jgi:HD-like signal output (HDOD) protein
VEISLSDETEQIRTLASQISGLPALPVIASRLLEAVDDPHTSASELASLIASDPALAIRLLRLANSAFYGFPKRIGTVNLAVVVLGFETVRDLCLSVLIADCFFHGEESMALDMDYFWHHSLSVAVGARMVYKMAGAAHPGEGFIAGLVHDTGKLFLARYFPQDYRRMLDKVTADEMPLLEAEKEVLSVTHPVAGAWLLEEWNLPGWLTAAIKYHHMHDHLGEYTKLTRSVGFADYLVRENRLKDDPYSVPLDPTSEYLAPLKPHVLDDDKPDLGFYLEAINQELLRSKGFMNTIQKTESVGE